MWSHIRRETGETRGIGSRRQLRWSVAVHDRRVLALRTFLGACRRSRWTKSPRPLALAPQWYDDPCVKCRKIAITLATVHTENFIQRFQPNVTMLCPYLLVSTFSVSSSRKSLISKAFAPDDIFGRDTHSDLSYSYRSATIGSTRMARRAGI